jgi:hypothetical protein
MKILFESDANEICIMRPKREDAYPSALRGIVVILNKTAVSSALGYDEWIGHVAPRRILDDRGLPQDRISPIAVEECNIPLVQTSPGLFQELAC